MSLRRPTLTLACAGMLACAATPSAGPDAPVEPSSFRLDRRELVRRGATPELLERLASGPYPYFRALADPFARRVCEEFRDRRWMLPQVLVHGDAHLEQFVATRDAYGLEDFDQVGTGPAVLDLVRYASSLHLACFTVEWPCNPEASIQRLLEGYAAGLAGEGEAVAPSIVRVLRSRGRDEAESFFAWAEDLMGPLSPAEDRRVREDWSTFVRFMTEVSPEREGSFFEVERLGRLQMGIGSALAKKYLLRVRGPTGAPEDDVILEAKRQDPPRGIACLATPAVGGMLRPLVAAAHLGRRLPEIMGFVPLEREMDGPEHFWVQSWTPGYAELSIRDLRDQRDIDELAYDAGLQLGTANAELSPAPLAAQLRWANMRALDLVREDVPRVARALAAETVDSWRAFSGEGRDRSRARAPFRSALD